MTTPSISNLSEISGNSQVENTVSFITTKRNGKQLFFHGYFYRISRKKESKSYWRCINGCKATVVLVNDEYERHGGAHNHSPNMGEIVAKLTKERIKRRVAAEHLVTVPQIYREEIAALKNINTEVSEHLPSLSSIRHTLYNVRHKNNPASLQQIYSQVPGAGICSEISDDLAAKAVASVASQQPSSNGGELENSRVKNCFSHDDVEMAELHDEPQEKLKPAERIANQGPSVWIEFIQLALEHKPLNLGQGFPDFPVPDYITKALSAVPTSENILLNQYTRGFGHPRLINILAKFYSKLVNRTINPLTEILITVGAYEALYCIIQGQINPGDEVIIIEPFYDCYEPMVLLAGGKPVFIPLRPQKKMGETMSSSEWLLDAKELESKFSKKTKAIIVNNPNNPLGKVYSLSELEMIAELAKKHDVLVIMDEVYEWLIFDGKQHTRMATLPDMWDRTLTVGSAGKTFSVTGWKTGWLYGPAKLVRNAQLIHQNCVFTCPTPTQEAVAICFEHEIKRLGHPECYFSELPTMLQEKRQVIVNHLKVAGMNPVIPEGGYFIIADYSKFGEKANFVTAFDEPKDYKFVKWLTIEKKLAGIPPSAFYCREHKDIASNYIRFCFFKDDVTLKQAGEILANL